MKTQMTSQAKALASVFAPVLLAYHEAEMKLESGFKKFLHETFHKYWGALPESKKADNTLAVQWKIDAIAASDSLGYQGQWVSKCLMAIEPELFRQRAKRSNAGKKAGKNARTASKPVAFVPLSEAQVAFEVAIISKVAKKLHLSSIQIEALILAIQHENDVAAKQVAKAA